MAEKLLTAGEQGNEGKGPLDLFYSGTEKGWLAMGQLEAILDHGKIVFYSQRRKEDCSRTSILDFQRADFGLISGLAEKVHPAYWEGILKDKRIQEHWIFSKVQEQIDPHVPKDETVGKTGLAE